MRRALDFYFQFPIYIDVFIAVLIYFLSYSFGFITFKLSDTNNQLNLLSNLIATSVSLSGFILAALTIIVTFKSNLKARGIEEADNALEMIFSSKHYRDIVKVFKGAIKELVIVFMFLFVVWAAKDNFELVVLNKFNVCAIFLLASTICRSLFILFTILDLEKYQRS